jgi:hypothetical protein
MSQTPNGASASYATAATLLRFYDAVFLGNLVNDDQTVAPASDLTDTGTSAGTTIQLFLDAAAGELEASALKGQRYDAASLSALTGVSSKHRDRIICSLVVGSLMWRRDPSKAPPPVLEWGEKRLEELEAGKAIFSFAETAEAGVTSLVTRTPESQQARNSVVSRARAIFGRHQATGCN